MKYELQNLIQGKGGDGKTNTISAIASYLNGCKEASNNNKGEEYTKELRHLDVGEYRTNKAGSVAGDE